MKKRLTLLESEQRDKLPPVKSITTLIWDEDGVWIAECPSIPGFISQGESRDEARSNIQEAIAACLEVRAARGMPNVVAIET
jgi:predicted RNase H-like HicB family nuclease